MIDIILINVESPENLGAIARVMKNFDFDRLVLISPEAKPNDIKARIVSRHAEDILKKAKVLKRFPFSKYDYVIGTTARIGTDYNVIRTPLTPEEASEKIIKLQNKKTALVFGPESSGLNNDFLSKCDFVIKIPASDYDTLNISHAVVIILYTLFLKKNSVKGFERIEPISNLDKKILEEKFHNIAKELFHKDRLKVELRVWKRIIGKATLSKREAFALLGFLSKIQNKIKSKKVLNKKRRTK